MDVETYPRRPEDRRELGARGEALAAEYLESLGYRVLERNWRNRYGEIDLIVQDGACVVAVEVKSRRGIGYGHPLEAITERKVARLRKLLFSWLDATSPGASSLRIDAVGIIMPPGGVPQIEHLRGIG